VEPVYVMGMKSKPLPHYERLHEIFSYDSQTGLLTWKRRDGVDRATRSWNTKNAGRSPRIDKHGYVVVAVDGHRFAAGRVIWKMMTGDDLIETDHRDGDPANNRWDNLRPASRSQQNMNRDSKGYYRDHTGRFRVQVCIEGRKIHVGRFATEEEARAAYLDATRKYFLEYSRHPAPQQ